MLMVGLVLASGGASAAEHPDEFVLDDDDHETIFIIPADDVDDEPPSESPDPAPDSPPTDGDEPIEMGIYPGPDFNPIDMIWWEVLDMDERLPIDEDADPYGDALDRVSDIIPEYDVDPVELDEAPEGTHVPDDPPLPSADDEPRITPPPADTEDDQTPDTPTDPPADEETDLPPERHTPHPDLVDE